MTISWQDALNLAPEGKTERFRWLCSDANPNRETREGYRAWIIRRAAGQDEPKTERREPIVRITDPWLPLIRACEDHNPGCCVHPSAFCTRFTRDVSREDCVACLTERGITP